MESELVSQFAQNAIKKCNLFARLRLSGEEHLFGKPTSRTASGSADGTD
jgi:hypothetical protein